MEIEADRIALRDETGAAMPIQDLFVNVEQVVTPVARETPIGPGLPPLQTLVYEDPSDEQVPALASLLEYLEQEKAPKHYHPDVALRAEVVHLIGLYLAQDLKQTVSVGKVAVVQLQARTALVGVLINVIKTFGVETTASTDDAVNFVAF